MITVMKAKVKSWLAKNNLSFLILLPYKFKKRKENLINFYLCYVSQKIFNQLGILSEIPFSPNFKFYGWLLQKYPRNSDLQQMKLTENLFNYHPKISIILPVYDPPIDYLKSALDSVLDQIYKNWELCIADDASTNIFIKEILAQYAQKDCRIKVIYRENNGHISACSNSAIEIATGEFIALLDHDDLLTPDALYQVVLKLNDHPDADMIYSDEDKIDDRGWLSDPFFKPDWCPDTFLSRMYTCHLGVYRKQLVDLIGGFRLGFEGAQDYDLVLRLTEKTDKIHHIPKILYHWRSHKDSTSKFINAKQYSLDAAQKALEEAIQRRGEAGKITLTKENRFIVRYEIREYKKVSIVIPTKDLGSVLNQCLTSIFNHTNYPNLEIILVNNNTSENFALKVINDWQQKEINRLKVIDYNSEFNFSKINNYAADFTEGEYLLFLNNDTEVLSEDWVTAMVEQAQRPQIGAVGGLLLYPDNSIQHAGVVLGLGGVAGHSHKYFDQKNNNHFNQIQTVNNYLAVTGACLMCRKDLFKKVGGFCEELSVAFNDIDLCLKFIDKGYLNVYLPHVKLYHYESKSRGYEDTPEKLKRFSIESEYMFKKWKKYIDHDTCYNKNLTKKYEDYSIDFS